MGKLVMKALKSASSESENATTKVKTCEIYKNKAGQKCYKGTKHGYDFSLSMNHVLSINLS